jgi:hypothetical protein
MTQVNPSKSDVDLSRGVATKADITRLESELVLHRWVLSILLALCGANFALTVTMLVRIVK